jgi:hypothetical protein
MVRREFLKIVLFRFLFVLHFWHVSDTATDDTPKLVVERPETCADVYGIFCPLVQCCAECSSYAMAWYTCSFDGFTETYLPNDNCSIEGQCSNFEYGPNTCDTDAGTPDDSAVTSDANGGSGDSGITTDGNQSPTGAEQNPEDSSGNDAISPSPLPELPETSRAWIALPPWNEQLLLLLFLAWVAL